MPALEEVDGEMIGHGNRKLEKLNLSSNKINDEGIIQMAEKLKAHLEEVSGTLKWLALQRNNTHEQAAEALQALEPITVVV